MNRISKTVWVLSLVSMFTDTASEMLYPIMPAYLKSIGFSIVLIGILEGIAEACAGLSKGYFGKKSDLSGRRVPYVRVGYLLSALSKPMMAVCIYPIWIFMARTTDRLGKGIRTAARDAILSGETNAENKGKIFGFHRSMDTFGAVFGPICALLFLYFYPENYTVLFLIAFIPGILAVLCTFFLKEKTVVAAINPSQKVSFFYLFKYWKDSSREYKKIVGGLLVFALINSSDMFLLLKASQSGLNDMEVIGVYIFYNLIYALTAYPLGILGDKIGLKNMFSIGLLVFAIVYFGIGFSNSVFTIAFFFALYGIYASATEGISKALIGSIIMDSNIASAFGTYAGFQSIAALLSSAFAGMLWYTYGSSVLFLFIGIASLCLSVFFVSQRIVVRNLK